MASETPSWMPSDSTLGNPVAWFVGAGVLAAVGVGAAVLLSKMVASESKTLMVATRPGARALMSKRDLEQFWAHNVGYNLDTFKRRNADELSSLHPPAGDEDIVTVMYHVFGSADHTDETDFDDVVLDRLVKGARDKHNVLGVGGDYFWVNAYGEPIPWQYMDSDEDNGPATER